MYPRDHARTNPDKPAFIMSGSGETVTFGELEDRANQTAHALRALGLQIGDTFAIFAENTPRFFEICWAAQRAGLYFVAISSRLTAPEVEYIINDSGSRLLIASHGLGSVATAVAETTDCEAYWSIDGDIEGFTAFKQILTDYPTTPIADEHAGAAMLYSSGTTGRPKGIRPALPADPAIDASNALMMIANAFFRASTDGVYLSPAPLYHAAPLAWCMTMTRYQNTIIIMEKFDAETFLSLVETYKITHTQLVPTMFVKMLKLPEDVRKKYDVSSLRAAVHAAAPCPIPIKEQIIDWWGPVVEEYYAGSEGNGMTWASSEQWLQHKGTVGYPVWGELHICNEDGDEVETGEEGQVYFGGTPVPKYHNDKEKTAGALNPKHQDWSSLGDIGRVDGDGFLYLTDRKAFMIISGGVNIYPQEAENVLITHPSVADVAVIGVPDEEFGEAVKAVVQPINGLEPSEELAEELLEYCQSQLAKIKCPRSVDFDPELPRHPTGKLYKRLVRDRYWGNASSRIV
ncbi:MAG: Long-chain-fatty-acid--CoA ligase FadD13 [Hyphomonas sp. TMED17]|nr:MAG: acyl-CoA synthetase [Hyphomonas sp. TMED17]CAI8344795.1 MAG: Long-chain-fatty-acid--CoA ligase FadD13 [Hyphomonas sp. TMED17]